MLDIVVTPPGDPNPSENRKVGGMALVDTGATHSCISADIATKVGITPDGEVPMNSASEVDGRSKTYLATLIIPNINLMVRDITLMEAAFPQQSPFQALLGRDILCRGTFHMDFAGNAVFCI